MSLKENDRIRSIFTSFHVDKDCASDTVCVNQFPNLGKKCVGQIRCQKGTRQVGIHCIDMDECEEGTHTCLDDQHCKNTFGEELYSVRFFFPIKTLVLSCVLFKLP